MLGEEEDFWAQLRGPRRASAPDRRAGRVGRRPPRRGLRRRGRRPVLERRAVLVAVADVPRRRAGLEAVVPASAPGPMPVVSWAALPPGRSSPRASSTSSRSIRPGRHDGPAPRRDAPRAPSLGPRRGRVRDRRLPGRARPRPQLAEVYRALRELPPGAPTSPPSRPPCTAAAASPRRGGLRPPPQVLTELGLIELDLAAPSCRTLTGSERARALGHLPRSTRASWRQPRRLAPELPQAAPAAATG